MKLQNLQGFTGKVNHAAYDTWLAPYIGHDVEVIKTSKNFAWIVTDYGHGKFGQVKVLKSYLDFNQTGESLNN